MLRIPKIKLILLCSIVMLGSISSGCVQVESLLSPTATVSATSTESQSVQVSPPATETPTQVLKTPTPLVTEIKIQVRGVGIAPKDETDPARRKRMAIRAAELEADRIYAQWQAGMKFNSETVNVEGTVELDTIRETIKASLRMLRNTIEEHFDNQTGEAEIVVEYVAEVAK